MRLLSDRFWLIILLPLLIAAYPAAAPATIRDDTGLQLVIPRPPSRIISLTPGSTEILYGLGLADRLVGLTAHCNYPPEAAHKEKIGDLDLNHEKILALRADMLLAVGNMPRDSTNRLRSLGLTVAVFTPDSLAGVISAIDRIGALTGQTKAARHLAAEMRSEIEAVRVRLAGITPRDKPRVFIEVWDAPLMTAGPGTFTAELLALAGGTDIAFDAKPWSTFSPELVITRNPQVIVSQCASAARIRTRPGWAGIEAVRRGRVYDVEQDIFSRPGPRLATALETLARLLYPERFRDKP